jgi:hypothetical protein
VRRSVLVFVGGALLLACSGGSSSRSDVTTTLPSSVANEGNARAAAVVDQLKKAGVPIGLSVPHPADDEVFVDQDGLTGKVDFRDERLLSTSSDIDESLDGGSVEVYRDENAAVSASKDRPGYVFVNGAVLLHLAGGLAPEWVIGYRDAFGRIAT